MMVDALYILSILVSVVQSAPQYPIIPAIALAPLPQMPYGVPMPVPIPPPPPIVNKICVPPPNTPPPIKAGVTKPKCACVFINPVPPPPPLPVAQPYLVPPSPILMPIPPIRKVPRPRRIVPVFSRSDDSDTSSDSDSSSDSDYAIKRWKKNRRRRKWRKKRLGIYRRNGNDSLNVLGDEKVQPVLSYVSENGKVMYRRRVGKENAALLLQKEMVDG